MFVRESVPQVPTPHAIGLSIRTERRRQGLTLRELAIRAGWIPDCPFRSTGTTAGISPNHLGKLERGLHRPRESTLERIREAFAITAERSPECRGDETEGP